MTAETPFSQDRLNRIFSVSMKHPDRLSSRESSWLEFKESFGFKSLGKYIRSAAAFANAKGGYIVYGVADKPHTLIGLHDTSFASLDPEKLTYYFNEHFDPEIKWERHIYESFGKTFGILYIKESSNKPVLCKKGTDDGKNLKEGEIYYRYSGRTQTIRYSELKELIEERRKNEQLLWFKHLKEIARIGTHEAGIFDIRSGKITGPGGSFYIDESLLSQVSFIKEGEFDEVKGRPTLKIIGEAKTIGANSSMISERIKVVKTKGIHAGDIILAFLNNEILSDPQAYLTQICYENTAYLPFYYLILASNLNVTSATKLIKETPATNPSRMKLLERLTHETQLNQKLPLPTSERGRFKLAVREQLIQKKYKLPDNVEDLRRCMATIRTLRKEEINDKYIKSLLKQAFQSHYARGQSSLTDDIRRAICFLDFMINSRSDSAAPATTPV